MPKIIHYFYDDTDIFEKNTSPQFRICYASWKRFCPDYEIKLWHTGMPEFKQILKDSKFVRECYKRKLWALVADYIRHYALYNYGGVYLDTDIQLIKNLDEFIDKSFFCSIEGDFYNRQNILETAFVGGQKGHKIFKDMLDIYNSDKIFSIDYFIDPIVISEYLYKNYNFSMINYSEDLTAKAKDYYLNTNSYQLEDYELYRNQLITKISELDIEIYPSEYFCPSWTAFKEKAFTENTVAIHWNQSSWWKYSQKIREVESMKYSNLFKRYWYRYSERLAKVLTFAILNKDLRRKIRNLITYK